MQLLRYNGIGINIYSQRGIFKRDSSLLARGISSLSEQNIYHKEWKDDKGVNLQFGPETFPT